MHRRFAVWLGGCLTLAGIAGAFWYFGHRESGTPHDPETRTAPPAPVARTSRSRAGFVGDQACARCHAEIAANYRRSPMAHSWTAASSGLPAELVLPGTVADPNGPYRYHVRLEHRRLIQQEVLAKGDATHRLTRAAAYLVGSGNHARAMVAETNGYLTQLPLGWFPREGKWKLNPGYELKNRRFDRPILPGCLACHGGYARHKVPTRNRYQLPVKGGIGCEQCHGPARDHVAFHDGEAAGGKKLRDPIVNPGRLKSGPANDVCLQCHLQGDVVVYRSGADPFSFRPGEKLSDHRLDFLIQTKQPEAFGVASHGSRMMRSRCYTAGGGKLTCFHCHDPHRPAADFSAKAYDSKCASCHMPQSCGRRLKKNETRNAQGCVRCHMPRRKTREGQHLVFTEHWIRKPPKGQRSDALPPLLPPDSQVSLVPVWPQADPAQTSLGIAYVKLHASMGPQRPALARGVALLERSLAETPGNPSAMYWLASGQIALHRSEAAVPRLRQLLQERLDWQQARFRLAVAYHQLKQYRQAIAEYERVIRDAPDWMEPYPRAVRLHLAQRHPKAARRLLKQQLSYREDATAYLNLALAKHLEGEPLAACLKPIDDSLRLDPRNATGYLTRAYLYVRAGRKETARRDYKTALEIDPDNREARAGLRAIGQSNR